MYGVVEKSLSAGDINCPVYDVVDNPPVDRVSAAHNTANVVDSPSGARATNNSAYDVLEKNPPGGAAATNNPAYGVVEKNPPYGAATNNPAYGVVEKVKSPPVEKLSEDPVDSPIYDQV